MGFYNDWAKATDEESKHFNLICDYFEGHKSLYDAKHTHAGMSRVTENTAGDFLDRLAIMPMVLEDLGLEVTPGVI